jgi:hypothetical protein
MSVEPIINDLAVARLPPRQIAIIEAASNLWPDGLPYGIVRRDIEAKIKSWLEEHGRSTASTSTIFLAPSKYPRQKPRLTGFNCE